jgi:pre-mRNA-splicing factor ATP-dependent RNA helicase DHX38/PRP16
MDEGRQIDRDWYEQSEGGACLDLTATNVVMDEAISDPSTVTGDRRGVKRKRVSERHLQNVQDTDRWEQQIFTQSGLQSQRAAYDPEADKDHNAPTVQLVVHERHPPFIEAMLKRIERSGGPKPARLGTLTFDPVQPVRDSTSDMARLARTGSRLVAEMRSLREQQRVMRSLTAGERHPSLSSSAHFPSAGSQGSECRSAEQDYSSSSFQEALKKNPKSVVKDSIGEDRRGLPIFRVRSQLLRTVADHQVTVIVGETGSGKTTQLTQYLLKAGYCPELTTTSGKRSLLIGCTQPRRVAAVSVAQRVSEEMGCAVGTAVGYAIRFEDCTTPGVTKIKYMTDGVLLRECLRDPDLDAYGAIIIDEAHERSLQTDILLGVLRELVVQRRTRPDLRIIVTSATMDAQKFSAFFGGAPVFNIPGRTFPVSVHWSAGVPEDYVEASVKQVLSLHASAPPGDILVFMTGQEDIFATCAALHDRLHKSSTRQHPDSPLVDQSSDKSPDNGQSIDTSQSTDNLQSKDTSPASQPRQSSADIANDSTLDVLPIYSQLPADLQARIFAPTPEGRRKCIVATNIAETSLTVDGIAYVVDCGLCKLKVYNARIGMDALQLAPISQAAAQQRAGRAGRTGPGQCYRMYPPRAFAQELFPNNIPEIARTNLANAVLLLKSLNIPDILTFVFMDAPPSDALVAALFQLWALGALDDDTGSLTPLGRKLVDFPLDPPLAKMLLVAAALGCVAETLTIVSMLCVPTVYHRPKEQLELSDARHEKFAVPESDHLMLLNLYNGWQAVPESRRGPWCQYHFVVHKALQRAHHVRTQLSDILAQSKVPVDSSCGRNVDVLRRVIASAHVGKACRLKGFGEYVNVRTGLPCALHPASSLVGLGSSPEYVVYNELLLTTREYMHTVTAVQPEWLAEAGPAFYSLRVSAQQSSASLPSTMRRVINFADADTPLRHAGYPQRYHTGQSDLCQGDYQHCKSHDNKLVERSQKKVQGVGDDEW